MSQSRALSLRFCLICALGLCALLPLAAQDGDVPEEPTPDVTGATEAPVDEPAAAATAQYDQEATSTPDTDGQYVYFGMFPNPGEDNVDRDIYRFKLPAQGSAVATADYERITWHWGIDSFARVTDDGTKMVYTSDRDRFEDATNPFYWDFELYIKDFKSGELTRLTKTFNDRELAPSISNDGKRVVYMADRFAQNTMSLYWMETDNPRQRNLLMTTSDKKTFAVISPDGQYVYFNEMDKDPINPAYDIFRIHLDTLKKENMTNTRGIGELHVDISGDGSKIVYERHKSVPPPASEIEGMDGDDPNHPNQLFEIYMLDTKTKKLTQITNNDIGDGFPSISSDGQWVIFQSARRNLDDEKGNEFELFAIKVGSNEEWQISAMKQSHDFVSVGF